MMLGSSTAKLLIIKKKSVANRNAHLHSCFCLGYVCLGIISRGTAPPNWKRTVIPTIQKEQSLSPFFFNVLRTLAIWKSKNIQGKKNESDMGILGTEIIRMR